MKNSPSRPTVLLFDIDGTLVDTGGAGRRAMEEAFRQVTGCAASMSFSFGGMTDRAIVRRALTLRELPVDEASMQGVIECYLTLLSGELRVAERYRVLPGVRVLLDALYGTRDVVIGLGTGNVRAGATLKLAHGNLDRSFTFGGFGCDSEDRPTLLEVGARRGAAALGRERPECRVVVIGDTLRDVEAAKHIGAECVAVATGFVPIETLRESGAEAVFGDLGEPGVSARLLGELS
jgi:phosphoglycolate phosphatase-like HAD superfamily hydrolase